VLVYDAWNRVVGVYDDDDADGEPDAGELHLTNACDGLGPLGRGESFRRHSDPIQHTHEMLANHCGPSVSCCFSFRFAPFGQFVCEQISRQEICSGTIMLVMVI
jgi:hypothetical protein